MFYIDHFGFSNVMGSSLWLVCAFSIQLSTNGSTPDYSVFQILEYWFGFPMQLKIREPNFPPFEYSQGSKSGRSNTE